MKKWKKKGSTATVKDVVLANFGVQGTDELNKWFIKSRQNGYRIDGLKEAADILRANKDNVIWIAGDYDADGIMATSICILALKQAGFKTVDYLIPERHTEGYGLNRAMVQKMAKKYPEQKVCLLTVDNGIVAYEPIDDAKALGWDVIVTDHHEGKKEDGELILPNADVIIDPKVIEGSADFNGYCGAGLAFRLARELLGVNEAKKLMPLAMVATFADVMPLVEENYVICRDGLNYLNKGLAPNGLLELVKVNKLDVVTDTDVLFKLAPEINAPGRLYPDGAMKCVSMMLSSGFNAALKADKCLKDNEQRKTMVKAASDRIMNQLKGGEDIIIEYLSGVNPGIVGIIAGHVTEQKKRPCIVFTDSAKGDGLLTGSARSVDAVHIKDALDAVQEHIVGYGGHKGAAGLTVEKDKFDEFKAALTAWVKAQSFSFAEADEEEYDLEITAQEIPDTLKELEKYAPYGEANPRPVFRINEFNFGSWSTVAGEGIKVNGVVCNAIGFGLVNTLRPEQTLAGKNRMVIYGTLSYNHFRGVSKPQVEFCDYETA